MLPDKLKTLENSMTLPTDKNNQYLPLLVPDTNLFQNHVDEIMAGIHFTTTEGLWTSENLRLNGYTHIIYIDKHVDKTLTTAGTGDDPSTNNIFSNVPHVESTDFEILELDFGETYLTTVLPNCYKAVKFIDKALQNCGAILVIDRNSNQKCLTIVIGYLMYKNNINFNDAYQRLKNVFTKAELERFFISQLHEYEPILQVQRAHARGHSCSGELRSSFLKRKKLYDDGAQPDISYNKYYQLNSSSTYYNDNMDVVME